MEREHTHGETAGCNVNQHHFPLEHRLREQINEEAKGEFKLSINDFVVKASALACIAVPEANSSWQGTFIRQYVGCPCCTISHISAHAWVRALSNTAAWPKKAKISRVGRVRFAPVLRVTCALID